MAKICFPHHTCGEFGSLNEAFHYLKKREYGSITTAHLFCGMQSQPSGYVTQRWEAASSQYLQMPFRCL